MQLNYFYKGLKPKKKNGCFYVSGIFFYNHKFFFFLGVKSSWFTTNHLLAFHYPSLQNGFQIYQEERN